MQLTKQTNWDALKPKRLKNLVQWMLWTSELEEHVRNVVLILEESRTRAEFKRRFKDYASGIENEVLKNELEDIIDVLVVRYCGGEVQDKYVKNQKDGQDSV